MAEVHQMVPGFNHNVRHRGNAYHVQTEDSGVTNPRIITHLFLGGNILASKKTSYAELVAAQDLKLVVRELMEEQHKDVLRNLVCGVYDDVDESLPGGARAYQPGELAPAEQEPAEAQEPEAPAFGQPYVDAAPMLPDLTTPMRPQIAAPILPDLTTPMRPQIAAPILPDLTTPMRPQIAASILPDLTAGTVAALPSLAPAPGSDAPAGPAASLSSLIPAAAPAAPPALPPLATKRDRPAARASAPAEAAGPRLPRGGSVVEMLRGEDLLTEKSLDEVILSYLAEEPTKKK